MATGGNNSKNVSVAKPKVTGGALYAPLGTTYPQDAVTPAGAAFLSVGYVGNDGLKMKQDRKSDTYRAWGGAVVNVSQSEFGETYTLSLIESRNANALKAVFGADNVKVVGDGDDATITINHNEQEPEGAVWLFDMKAGKDRRIVLPNALLSDVGDITYADGGLIEYQISLTALPDENGNCAYEYVGGTEPAAAPAAGDTTPTNP